GEQIINIHLHDNDGSFDQHKVPGTGIINFKPIVKALKKINYDKLITLEIYGAKDADEIALESKIETEKILTL
ncbi:MAG: TIM barrel protein, partial [Candidatus Jordarchaeaceae archaeon]